MNQFQTYICYKDPESHPFITEQERFYLKKELGTLRRDKNLPPTPWRAIFTSIPVWALIIAQLSDFGFYVMAVGLLKTSS